MKGMTFTADPKAIKSECLNGVYSEFASILGMDAALKIHSVFRGQQVFFPLELFSKEFIRGLIQSGECLRQERIPQYLRQNERGVRGKARGDDRRG